MELMFIKHLVVLFLLIITVPKIIDAGFAIKNEKYQQTKNVSFNFTRVDLGTKLSRIQCSGMCSEDSSCLGVGIQASATGGVRCFKMKNDSAGYTVLPDGLIYLKVTPVHEMGDDVGTLCSSPWTMIANLTGCYHVGADQASWDAAEDACQNMDAQAHLVSFETYEERQVVSAHVLQQNGGSAFWTGRKDHDGNNIMTWTGTGELLPNDESVWYYYDYRHYYGDCVQVYGTEYLLESTGCTTVRSFICEIH